MTLVNATLMALAIYALMYEFSLALVFIAEREKVKASRRDGENS